MSTSRGRGWPGQRGRMILRQLSDAPRGVPRPHFALRIKPTAASQADCNDDFEHTAQRLEETPAISEQHAQA